MGEDIENPSMSLFYILLLFVLAFYTTCAYISLKPKYMGLGLRVTDTLLWAADEEDLGNSLASELNKQNLSKRKPSAVGARRNSPSNMGSVGNINSANAQAKAEYDRLRAEGDGWKRSDIRNTDNSSGGDGNGRKRVYNGRAGGQQRSRSGSGGGGPPGRRGEFSNALTDQWQSGRVFNKKNGQRGGGRRRNDPWWMSDEERNNPRILPVYKPWWLASNALVDSSWKIVDLRKEAMHRVDENGKVGAVAGKGGYGQKEIDKMGKSELVNLLASLTQAYTLSSEGYSTVVFNSSQETGESDRSKPSCYPEVYEGGRDKMMKVVTEAYNQILDGNS